MKKVITVIGLMIVVMSLVMISGCAEREQGAATPEHSATETASSTASPTVTETTPEPSVTEDAETGSGTLNLSEDDLEKLREDLEGLEFEDLGGLSEE